jgi:hypothetical protein
VTGFALAVHVEFSFGSYAPLRFRRAIPDPLSMSNSLTFLSPLLFFLRGRGSLAFFLSVTGTAAAEEVLSAPVIELPRIVVTDSRELPPLEAWRYAEIPGFEILTNAPDGQTQKLLREFQLFSLAVDVVWFGLQEKRAVPISLIICGRDGKFDDFVPAEKTDYVTGRVSLFLKDREQAAVILDLEAKTIDLATVDLANAQSGVAPPPAEDGPDAASADAMVFNVDHHRQLYREYLRFLLSRSDPRLPPWFEEGLSQLFMGMVVERDRITFAKLESVEQGVLPPTGDNDFNRTMQGNAIIPLDDFFAVPHASSAATRPLGNRWSKQAQGLVHLWIFGENQRHQPGLVKFLRRLQKEPPSERLFEECFKMNYKSMLSTFRGYTDFTVYKFFKFTLPKGKTLPEPPALDFRDATLAEIGRIKGDVMRMAGHAEAAHATLIAPYIRGERDPRLLASIGLEELASGRADRAEKFLVAATDAKVARPRAYLELARLRSQAHLAKPAGADNQLSASQTRDILAPLLIARHQPPPLFEVYELMADTLIRSAEIPTRETLVALFDGANLFPGRLGIAYNTAVLCLRAGELKGARALIDRALAIAPAGRHRALFLELQAALPPPAPATAPTKR